jgi:hypothetical protein
MQRKAWITAQEMKSCMIPHHLYWYHFLQFDWLRYFNRFLPVTVDGSEEIVVFAPEFLRDMVDLVEQTDERSVCCCFFFYMTRNVNNILLYKYKDFYHLFCYVKTFYQLCLFNWHAYLEFCKRHSSRIFLSLYK